MNLIIYFAIAIIAFLTGYMIEKHKAEKHFTEKIRKEEAKSTRYLIDMRIDLLMITRYVSGIGFDKMLKAHNFQHVAIYGAANVGKCLYHFLDSSEIEVVCFIDKTKSAEMLYDIPICDSNNIDPNIDAIIVTPLTYFDEIYDDLNKKVDCPIIPVVDILGDK